MLISLQTIFQFQQLVFFHFKLLILGLVSFLFSFRLQIHCYFVPDTAATLFHWCKWQLCLLLLLGSPLVIASFHYIHPLHGRQPPTIFAILPKGCRTNFPVYKSGVGPFGLIHAWTTSRSWHDIASILLTTSCQELNSPWNFKEGTYSFLKSNRTYPFGRKTSNSPKSNYI